MKSKYWIIVGIVAWLLSSSIASAIEDLHFKVQGPDVLFDWPSVEGELFIIVYRETMETNTPWVFLATNLPAATGTNRTTFVHTNGAYCPGGGGMGMMTPGGAGGGSVAEGATEETAACESKDSASSTSEK